MKAEKENKHSKKSIAVQSEHKEQSRGVEYALQRTPPRVLSAPHCSALQTSLKLDFLSSRRCSCLPPGTTCKGSLSQWLSHLCTCQVSV